MFLERLSQVSARIEGARALTLVGEDGIAVESVSSSPDLDLDLIAAELIAQLRGIAHDNREFRMGEVQQFSVTTDRYTFIVSAVARGYFLLLVLGECGVHGRARFELRRARQLFEKDLE